MADDRKPDKDKVDDTPKDPSGDEPKDPTDWKAEAEKWKAHSRKHEGQAKANADAAKRLQEIEDEKKSEIEKLTERTKAAEAKADAAEREVGRLRIALRKGLTETQAKRLVGDTDEELESDADELLESFGGKKDGDKTEKPDADKPKGTDRRPKETLRPGAAPDAEPEELDPKKLAAEVPSW